MVCSKMERNRFLLNFFLLSILNQTDMLSVVRLSYKFKMKRPFFHKHLNHILLLLSSYKKVQIMSKVELTNNLSIASKKCKNIILFGRYLLIFYLQRFTFEFLSNQKLLNDRKNWRKCHCSRFSKI